jgi:hypothetical protein
MRRPKAGDPTQLNSDRDDKVVSINSRDYNQTSGSGVALQVKPNQATDGTSSIRGLEVQPRFASAIGGGDLVGANISAILKGTTGNLTGNVHVLELETDFNGGSSPTRHIGGDVTMIRFSGDFPSGMTWTAGVRSVFSFAEVSFLDFTHLFKFASTNTTLVQNAAIGSVSKMIPVLSTDGSTTLYIPLYPHS